LIAAIGATSHRRWSTVDVEPRKALAYWIDTICQSFLEIDIETPEQTRFEAQLDSADFGPGQLYVVQARAQRVRRTPARIARSSQSQPYALLMQLRQGRGVFRQYGRECDLQVGDCVVVDCNEPYLLDCLGATRSVVMRFPQSWLSSWIPSTEAVAARTFRATDRWGNALSAALSNLESFPSTDLALPAGIVAEQLAALLALAAGPDARVTNSSDRLLQGLQEELRERCHEVGLTPAQLAARRGISSRYLHLLFARSGTTFGSELMRHRLAAAHRMLNDSRYTNINVTEIAARCGFAEPSHFARRFRKTYGVGPSEFRRRRGGSVDQ
jgi:AraC family transcriptional regulator, positive regulator of tynA and feaB